MSGLNITIPSKEAAEVRRLAKEMNITVEGFVLRAIRWYIKISRSRQTTRQSESKKFRREIGKPVKRK